MIGQLNSSDVIKSNKRIIKEQNIMILDLLKDFNNLLEENISKEDRKSIREDINNKINDYLSKNKNINYG
jgi:predicted methyltransferase